jgi:hypothetical protein
VLSSLSTPSRRVPPTPRHDVVHVQRLLHFTPGRLASLRICSTFLRANPSSCPCARGATACHGRCRQLLLTRAAPLSTLTLAPLLLHDLLYSLTRFSSTAIPFPERSSSPDLRRNHCSPSTATTAASQPRSNTPAAPRQPTDAPQPIQFHSSVLEHHLPLRQQAQAPPPLGLTIDSPPQSPSAFAKSTSNTTSFRKSFPVASSPSSGTPVTGTTSPSLPPRR